MPLIDALQSGVNLINSSNQGVLNAAQARYANPMAAAQLYQTQTENQFLPDKLKLANQYQSLINQYYGPSMMADINAKNTETKFTPLKYAIEAQNSNRNNTRFGASSDFIRAINQMKGSDQEIFLSDPANLASYKAALSQMGAGAGNAQYGSLLTPKFLSNFGLASDTFNPSSPTTNAAPSGLAGAPGGNPPPPQPPATVQQAPQPSAPGAAPANLPPSGLGASPSTPAQAAPSQPTTPVTIDQAHPAVQQAVVQHIADNAPNQELTPDERQALAHQSLANQKVAGAKLWNRAQGAVTLENLLNGDADTTKKRILNATQYAGALGKGQYAIDQLMNNNKDAYTDYKWYKQDFVPNLANNIKVMEQLASTDSQREQLNEMLTNAINWDTNPEAATKLINMSIDLFHNQAKATLKAAQSVNPGVLEKLNGINNNAGNYLSNAPKYSKDDLNKMAQDAIAKGADPKAVKARLEKLQNG